MALITGHCAVADGRTLRACCCRRGGPPSSPCCRAPTDVLDCLLLLRASLFACQLRRNCFVVSITSLPSSISEATWYLSRCSRGVLQLNSRRSRVELENRRKYGPIESAAARLYFGTQARHLVPSPYRAKMYLFQA